MPVGPIGTGGGGTDSGLAAEVYALSTSKADLVSQTVDGSQWSLVPAAEIAAWPPLFPADAGKVPTSGTDGKVRWALPGPPPYAGTTPDAPVALAPVDYLLSTLNGDTPPACTYDDTAGTLTENDATQGVLSADGASPSGGQRVLWYYNGASDGNNGETHGIYVVTEPGNGTDTPWVLTRAADCASVAQRCRYWTCGITSGVHFAAGSARVTNFDAGAGWFDASPAASGAYSTASGAGSTASGVDSTASGVGSTASGAGSTASGVGSTASAAYSTASGAGSTASAAYSTASGAYSTASAAYSTASGVESTASGAYSTASGAYSTAYSNDQAADTLSHSRTPLEGQTADDTPTPLAAPDGGTFTFQTTAQVADYTKTARVRGAVVARCTTPGTDSAWTFDGVIRGDGTTAYTWVGDAAPTATVVAQDAGASAWAVALTISGASIVVTVTGAAATAISWACDLEIVEVAG
jgi:hypothetical protein